MINGNSNIVEFGKESVYGTAIAPTVRVAVTSANFKPLYNKKDEGLLTGGIGKGLTETMSIKTEGSLSTLAKPESVGYFLAGLFGVESVSEIDAQTNLYTHTFTPIGNAETDKLPSYTFTLDRKAGVYNYNGTKIDSISFSAAAEDRLSLDITTVGKDEATGIAISAALTAEANRAFKFHQAKVYVDDTEFADVDSIKFEYKNNLDSSIQTTATGKYFAEPTQGTREATSELECIFSTASEVYRNGKFKEDSTLKLVIEFTDDNANVLRFTLPVAQITAMDIPEISDGTAKQSLTITAVDNSTCFAKAELLNTVSTSYLA